MKGGDVEIYYQFVCLGLREDEQQIKCVELTFVVLCNKVRILLSKSTQANGKEQNMYR